MLLFSPYFANSLSYVGTTLSENTEHKATDKLKLENSRETSVFKFHRKMNVLKSRPTRRTARKCYHSHYRRRSSCNFTLSCGILHTLVALDSISVTERKHRKQYRSKNRISFSSNKTNLMIYVHNNIIFIDKIL